jgi:ABC-type iron transport system FetAB permease component
MTQFLDLAVLLPVIAVLTVVTNIIVEVFKKLTYKHIPTQFFAVAVAEGLTTASYFAYAAITLQPTYWYTTVGAVVVGMMVAYAAMFGFDTLKEALKGVNGNGKD